MLIKNISLTLLRCDLKKGNAKATGNPYAFYTCSVTDEDAKVFSFNLADELIDSLGEDGLKKLTDTRVEKIDVDLDLFPRTIGKATAIGGSITKIY